MLFLPFEEAWAVYLRAAPRLPPPPPPVEPVRVLGLLEVADAFDLIVFDAYGVLHVGGEGFASARSAFAALRAQGKAVCVVTNDVTHEPGRVAEGLNRRGFDVTADEVVSGRSLLPDTLDAWAHRRIGLISSHPMDVLRRFPDLVPVGQGGWDADVLAFVDCNDWTEADADRFFAEMERRPRPLIVCNPDVACPYGDAISAEPGWFAHVAAERFGAPLTFLGKPFPAVYRRVLQRFPTIRAERMLMVGDSPHTDVLGGRGIGMKCLLVETGFLRGRDSRAFCAEAALLPDFIAPQP